MKELNSEELFNIIGTNVKYYRKLYNLNRGKMTQENLAELVDVSTALIGNLESEKISQGISVVTLWKISQALEVPIENLFDKTRQNRKTS
ncbi:MAG: helix-turn-helix transcriptional regulator [Clostridia bacterium]|nr:helix-turn-helix transcriptional regulator [Clostridia bacterium]